MRFLLATASLALLAGCGGGTTAAVTAPVTPVAITPTPTPTPTPSPTPTPTQTPAPSPTPSPAPSPTAVDGKIIVASEGDSISALWGGNHTGMYKSSRLDVEFHGLAVGGSGLNNLRDRLPALLSLKPDVVSVYIGANDLADYPSADAYATALKSYVSAIRATGAKVVVGTNLPQYIGVNLDYTDRFNRRRHDLALILRNADWVDGVFDAAASTDMGPNEAARDPALYTDGVHPTDPTHVSTESGQAKLFRIYKAAMDKLVKDWR